MNRQHNAAPVVIRRKKVVKGRGHHGGAWKVAYADFVTAMMAFFLIMWLLNATTETQRKGLADYFSPTIPVNQVSGGGAGAFGGDSIFSQRTMARSGRGGTTERRGTDDRVAAGATGEAQTPSEGEGTRALEQLAETLHGRGGESRIMRQALRHVVTRVTDEGLVVELFDRPGRSLFAEGSVTPEPVLELLADMVADVFGLVENGVAIEGHTRAYPVVLRDNPTWQLSTDRARRARVLLQGAGVGRVRLLRVTGHGDRKTVADDAMAMRNNRLEVILLRDRVDRVAH